MLEKARKDVHVWVEILKNLDYDFPENLWEVKPGTSGIPDEVHVKYLGENTLSYEEMKELERKLHEIFPAIEEDEEFPLKKACCIGDDDKYFMPDMKTGLCLWVYIYSKTEYGICMTNCW